MFMKAEEFDYSMMVDDIELVNATVKTVRVRGDNINPKKTTVDIIHVHGLSYIDMPTDNNGPIMKATLLLSGNHRLHFDNFKDREEGYCWDMIKITIKNYYSKDNGNSWKPITKNGTMIKKSYA